MLNDTCLAISLLRKRLNVHFKHPLREVSAVPALTWHSGFSLPEKIIIRSRLNLCGGYGLVTEFLQIKPTVKAFNFLNFRLSKKTRELYLAPELVLVESVDHAVCMLLPVSYVYFFLSLAI